VNEKRENGVRLAVLVPIVVALLLLIGALVNHEQTKSIPTMTVVASEAKSFLETPTPTTGVVSGQNQNVKESDLGPVRVRQTVNPMIKE
jgi:hypothetical protein